MTVSAEQGALQRAHERIDRVETAVVGLQRGQEEMKIDAEKRHGDVMSALREKTATTWEGIKNALTVAVLAFSLGGSISYVIVYIAGNSNASERAVLSYRLKIAEQHIKSMSVQHRLLFAPQLRR